MNYSKLAGVVCGAACLLGHRVALADISIGDSGATEDFATFTGTGFSATPAAGQLSSTNWAITGFSDGDLNFGGSNTSLDYTRKTPTTGMGAGGPGASTGIYNFYVPGTTNNVFLGVFPGQDDFTPGTITARFKNTRAKAIVKLQVAYRVLTWNNTARINSLKGEYSTDNATWTDLALTVTTTGALDATPSWDSASKSTTINVTIPVNGNFYIRWTGSDSAGAGADGDSMGIDDIVLTPQNGCGDGVAAGTEGCDDGNQTNTDGCTNVCQQAVCGDNIVRTSVEECDGSVCCGAPNTPHECEKLTGTTCPGGMCAAGACVPTTTGGAGEGGDTSTAGEGGNTNGGEGGSAAGRGGRTGRGGRGGMGGVGGETAGGPAAGTSGAPAAGTAGAPAAGTAGASAGGAPTAGTSAGGTPAAGGRSGSGGTAGAAKGGTGTGGKSTKPPASSSSDDDSGCGCSVPRSSNHSALALVFMGALATFMRRRRRS